MQLWTQRADAAMITSEVPWEELLNGIKAEKYVADNFKGLVDFYNNYCALKLVQGKVNDTIIFIRNNMFYFNLPSISSLFSGRRGNFTGQLSRVER